MDGEAEDGLERADRARRGRREGEAFEAALHGLRSARPTEDPSLYVRALQKLAQLERDRGRLEDARALYAEAAERCRDGLAPRLLAHTLRHLGDVLLDAGRAAEAVAPQEEALALYRAEPRTPPPELANALRSMALLREATGDAAAARAAWEEARALYEQVGLDEGVAECDAHLDG